MVGKHRFRPVLFEFVELRGMERKIHRLVALLALAAVAWFAPARVFAQEADRGDSAAAAEPAEKAAAPADPKRSPLAAEPKSADELFEATLLMADVARFDLAAMYLDKLLEETPDDDLLMALRDKYGTAAFLKLTNIEPLRTQAVKLLDLSNAAAIRRAGDAARIARLIDALEGDPEDRAEAQAELKALGPYAVPGLLKVLQDAAKPERHESATTALLSMGDAAVPQLLGALDTTREALRVQVIAILGALRSSEALPFLWYPATSPDVSPAVRGAARQALERILKVTGPALDRVATEGAAAQLTSAARECFRLQRAWKTDESGNVTLWAWDAGQETIVPRQLPPDVASDFTGLRLAREALALAPNERATQVLYLCLALAADIRRSGFDKPIPTGPGTAHDLALSVGSDVALDVLASAFDATRPAVAVAALRVFSQVGTLDQLNLSGSRRSVVAAALDYPDQRVQFAAAVAILQIDPKAPFRGATRVVEILKRALGSEGRAQAVVGEVSATRGALVGGFLRDLGYEPVVVTSGRDAFLAAAGRSSVELVVLHPNIIRWALSETMANLRADARTQNIPIVVHGPGDLAAKLQPRVRSFQLVSYSISSETTEDFEFQLAPFLRQIRTAAMTPQERVAQRADAAAWLAHIAQGRRTRIFDITVAEPELIEALDDEKLAPAALEALGEVATRTTQTRLAELVDDTRADLELRKTAALKLAFHIQRFGLLIAQPIIDRLHSVWQNARERAELRTALGGVIGSLKPDAVLTGRRLKARALAPVR
jgi:hypothetical protein